MDFLLFKKAFILQMKFIFYSYQKYHMEYNSLYTNVNKWANLISVPKKGSIFLKNDRLHTGRFTSMAFHSSYELISSKRFKTDHFFHLIKLARLTPMIIN